MYSRRKSFSTGWSREFRQFKLVKMTTEVEVAICVCHVRVTKYYARRLVRETHEWTGLWRKYQGWNYTRNHIRIPWTDEVIQEPGSGSWKRIHVDEGIEFTGTYRWSASARPWRPWKKHIATSSMLCLFAPEGGKVVPFGTISGDVSSGWSSWQDASLVDEGSNDEMEHNVSGIRGTSVRDFPVDVTRYGGPDANPETGKIEETGSVDDLSEE